MGFILTPAFNGVLVDRKLEILLSRACVQELLIFIQQEKEPTLRMIKAAFNERSFPDLNEVIDTLIDYHYIERRDRRYYICAETLTDDKIKEVEDEVSDSVKTFIQWVTNLDLEGLKEGSQLEIDNTLLQAHLLMYLLSSFNDVNTLTLYSGDDSLLASLKNMTELAFEKETWCEISHLTLNDDSFHSYFMAVERHQTLSNLQQSIFDVIGDVNVEFFLHHCATKLKRARRRGSLDEDYNIFNDTLLRLGYLKENADHHLESTVMIYSKKQALSFLGVANQFTSSTVYQTIFEALHRHPLHHFVFATRVLDYVESLPATSKQKSKFLLLS